MTPIQISNEVKNKNKFLQTFSKKIKDLIVENGRLRTALIEKDRILKQKDDIIKNIEYEALKKSSNPKKSYGCLKI